jgi:homoserine O-succinyltransferase/O-acetyltransferase
MPVILDSAPRDHRTDRCIHIGLINNMSDEALKATERQFVSLLNSASDGVPVRLSLYTLPGVPRDGWAAGHISSNYSNIEDLWDGHLDGLIVTGREPLAANLVDEPYWDSFTRVLDWAQENSHATVCSCLAAHAAILHMNGIRRAKRNDKLFGIFECAHASDHPLTAGTPASFRLPHSRWNGVLEDQLLDCGFTVLTRSAEAGVDTFIKQQKKLFVFFQGHPEYDSGTLLREYHRDVGRYVKGESQKYPSMPQNYFDAAAADELVLLREKASSARCKDLLTDLAAILLALKIEKTWQPSAVGIYRNLLAHISVQKETALVSKRVKAIAGMQASRDEESRVMISTLPTPTEAQTASLATKLLINNRCVSSELGKTFATVNPLTGGEICQVAEADTADEEKAVKAARAAFEQWDGKGCAPQSADTCFIASPT